MVRSCGTLDTERQEQQRTQTLPAQHGHNTSTRPIWGERGKASGDARPMKRNEAKLGKGRGFRQDGVCGVAGLSLQSRRIQLLPSIFLSSQVPAGCIGEIFFCAGFPLTPITSSLTAQIADNKGRAEGPSFRRG